MAINPFIQIYRRLSRLEKALHNLVIIGRAVEPDYNAGTIKVDDGAGLKTKPIPWVGQKTKGVTSFDAPMIGQKMIAFNFGGESFAFMGGFSDEGVKNGNDPNVSRTDYADGTYIEYNQNSGNLAINLVSSLNLTVGSTNIRITSGEVLITGADLKLPQNNTHAVNVIAASGITFGAGGSGGSMKGTGNIDIKGSITSTGDQKAGGISQINHTHSGVQSGGSATGKPK